VENNPFQVREPVILDNAKIRTPQKEAYAELVKFAADGTVDDREVGIVLPVGCGMGSRVQRPTAGSIAITRRGRKDS
jgi:hypothetical protein